MNKIIEESLNLKGINEMQCIIYDTFGDDSPIQLLKLTNADYRKIPILNQLKYLADLIREQGELSS